MFLIPGNGAKTNRPKPVAAPHGYQTWSTRFYWREATCHEVECDHYVSGWVTAIDETTQLGREQADYIRHHSGRHFTVTRTEEGWTAFQFPPGQTCFNAATHQVQAEREPLYLVQSGDHRNLIGRARFYDRGDQFADDLHDHTNKIADRRRHSGTSD